MWKEEKSLENSPPLLFGPHSLEIHSFFSVGIGLIAEDLFAAALGDEVGLTGERGNGVVEILPEEDAAGLCPFEREGYVVFEDVGSIGEEAKKVLNTSIYILKEF